MGALVMLGTLFGLIAVVYGVVLRFDPEAARRPRVGEAPETAGTADAADAPETDEGSR